MLVLNIYMVKIGYTDPEIANIISYRFLGVMLIAFPLGLLIKGRKLMPFFYVSAICGPVLGLLTLYGIENHLSLLTNISVLLWGISLTCVQVVMLPFIMRNAKKETQSEAISLNYATWSISTIITGTMIFSFSWIDPVLFDEKFLLQLVSILGFGSIIVLFFVKIKETVPAIESSRYDLKDFDWPLIVRSMVPVLIIAVGAGLTIPFINLFFFNVHGLDFDEFSFLGSITACLVAFAALGVPYVKRRFGYKVAITVGQTMAVLALILLATTEFYSSYNWAIYIAGACYMLRQPLMNMAGPMTSELTMNYVGERNQEMTSSLIASIWSGSWFFSSQIFRFFREEGFNYSTIFFITAALYAVGVIWYYFLIVDYERRKIIIR